MTKFGTSSQIVRLIQGVFIITFFWIIYVKMIWISPLPHVLNDIYSDSSEQTRGFENMPRADKNYIKTFDFSKSTHKPSADRSLSERKESGKTIPERIDLYELANVKLDTIESAITDLQIIYRHQNSSNVNIEQEDRNKIRTNSIKTNTELFAQNRQREKHGISSSTGNYSYERVSPTRTIKTTEFNESIQTEYKPIALKSTTNTTKNTTKGGLDKDVKQNDGSMIRNDILPDVITDYLKFLITKYIVLLRPGFGHEELLELIRLCLVKFQQIKSPVNPEDQLSLVQKIIEIIKQLPGDVFPKSSVHSKTTNETSSKIKSQIKTLPKVKVRSPVSVRDERCDGCFSHDFQYLIENDQVCENKTEIDSIDLILMITTAHDHFDRRMALRQTWLAQTKNNTANIRYAFLLGQVDNTTLRELVDEENKKYRDIIKEHFVDTYANLTYKTVMAMKWAATKCSKAKFVMKTDDDMFINLEALMAALKTREASLQGSIGGRCNSGSYPIRDPKSKWYASKLSYSQTKYPAFCSGTAYVTSMTVANKLYKISSSVPFFHLEDVYIGLCVRQARLDTQTIPGFHIDRPKVNPCSYKGKTYLTVHYMTPELLYETWNATCATETLLPHRIQYRRPVIHKPAVSFKGLSRNTPVKKNIVAGNSTTGFN